MRAWLADIVGEDMATGAMLVIVTLAIVIAFAILFAIYRSFSTSGVGNNRRTRQARLAVMDAAAVDSKRRLVLIRRDDVEHLVMIGGPSDIVVEQNIKRQQVAHPGKVQQTSRPAAPPAASKSQPQAAAPPSQAGQKLPEVTPPPARSATVMPTHEPVPKPATQIPAPKKPQPAPAPKIQPDAKPAEPEIPPTPAPIAVAPVKKPPIVTGAISATGLTPPTDRPTEPAPPRITPATVDVASKPVPPVLSSTLPRPSPARIETPEKPTENQLSSFEDELAMELGETIVTDTPLASEGSLSTELDELLSEMTTGPDSKT